MDPARDWEAALVERLRCPQCRGRLRYDPAAGDAARAICPQCRAAYPRRAGIWYLLTAEQQQHYRPFLASYRRLRRREGWERAPAYYLSLPYVKRSDPAAGIWRIRRRSLRRSLALIGPGAGRWALDLGAGNGWLARRLTRRGFVAVAADLNAAGIEGLAGGQMFLQRDGPWFGRVQAAMDALPFADAAFAVCLISSALYYADVERTIAGVWRLLAPGGLLVITDSPIYSQAAAGAAMAAEQRARTRALLGAPVPLPGGAGFLVEAQLLAMLQRVGFVTQVISTERRLGRLRRWLRQRLQPGHREHARFPVVVARKPPLDTRG